VRGVKEMDYRIFGALVTLKSTGAITKERFLSAYQEAVLTQAERANTECEKTIGKAKG
jgi:hypothetical protein